MSGPRTADSRPTVAVEHWAHCCVSGAKHRTHLATLFTGLWAHTPSVCLSSQTGGRRHQAAPGDGGRHWDHPADGGPLGATLESGWSRRSLSLGPHVSSSPRRDSSAHTEPQPHVRNQLPGALTSHADRPLAAGVRSPLTSRCSGAPTAESTGKPGPG